MLVSYGWPLLVCFQNYLVLRNRLTLHSVSGDHITQFNCLLSGLRRHSIYYLTPTWKVTSYWLIQLLEYNLLRQNVGVVLCAK